ILEKQKEAIFSPETLGEVHSLQMGEHLFKFEQGKITIGEKNIEVDPVKMNEVFAVLDGFNALYFFTSEELAQFDMNFAFPEASKTFELKAQNSDIHLTLGVGVPAMPGQFYAKINDQVAIVYDKRPLPEAYQAQDEATLKRQRIEELFKLEESFFYWAKLFKTPPQIVSVDFDNRFARPYVMNLENKTT